MRNLNVYCLGNMEANLKRIIIPYDSNSMTSWKGLNYGDSKKIIYC